MAKKIALTDSENVKKITDKKNLPPMPWALKSPTFFVLLLNGFEEDIHFLKSMETNILCTSIYINIFLGYIEYLGNIHFNKLLSFPGENGVTVIYLSPHPPTWVMLPPQLSWASAEPPIYQADSTYKLNPILHCTVPISSY